MAEEMKPASKKQAPEPSKNYERSDPKDEPGMGKLTHDADAPPAKQADKADEAVHNRREPKELER